MLFVSRKPEGLLGAFVEDFWLYQDYVGAHSRESILPSGTFELVFNLREDEIRIYDEAAGEPRRFAGSVISGPYARPFFSDIAEEYAMMGVHFRPGGAFAILGMAASELGGNHLELEALWGRSARLLRERLCAASNAAERFRLLEESLTRRMMAPAETHPAVRTSLQLLHARHGMARTSDLANAADLSQKRLIDLFSREVGATPKLYARITRFQRAVTLIHRSRMAGLADLALRCGYYDQSHMIRDFGAFAGVTPAAFMARQRQLHAAGTHVKRNHLPSA